MLFILVRVLYLHAAMFSLGFVEVFIFLTYKSECMIPPSFLPSEHAEYEEHYSM